MEKNNEKDYYQLFEEAIDLAVKKEDSEINLDNYLRILCSYCRVKGIPKDVLLSIFAEIPDKDHEVFNKHVCDIYDLSESELCKFVDFAEVVNSNTVAESPTTTTNNEEGCPFISENVYSALPKILQVSCDLIEGRREKDIFFLSTISVLSGCFTRVKGNYAAHSIYPNLFLFVVAPPANGKGTLVFAKEMAMPIHRAILQESRRLQKKHRADFDLYRKEMQKRKSNDTSPEPIPPKEPPFKVLYIPGNTSSAGIIEHLQNNDGVGIIFETEADSMGNNFKQDWGSFSDILRKGFQNEPVSYSRKGNIFIEVEKPMPAVILSGTPNQVPRIINSPEDGLASRIIFYRYYSSSVWNDVSPSSKGGFHSALNNIALQIEKMMNFLGQSDTEICLTEQQWKLLNSKFKKTHDEVSAVEHADSIIRRLGMIAFKIAMIFTSIRKFENQSTDSTIYCTDSDLEIALLIVNTLKEHSLGMLFSLQSNNIKVDKAVKRFFEKLPSSNEFKRADAVSIGNTLNLSERTSDGYLKRLVDLGLLKTERAGLYKKV